MLLSHLLPRLSVPFKRRSFSSAGGSQGPIGFLGLGNMGSPMAHNLLKANYEVVCFDQDDERTEKMVAAGARAATSAAELAQSVSTLVSVLPNDKVLTSVLLGDDNDGGILHHLPQGSLHLSCSTISPTTARLLDIKHQDCDVSYVSSPIFARPDGMEAMQATFVVSSNDPNAVQQATSLLACTSANVYDFSNGDAGAANVVKVCGNFLIASAIEAMAEALTLAESHGVDRVQAMQFYSSTFLKSPIYKGYGQRVSERDHQPGGFSLELGYKDQKLADVLSTEKDVPMPFLSTLLQRFKSQMAKGRSDLDWSAISLGVSEDHGDDIEDAIRSFQKKI